MNPFLPFWPRYVQSLSNHDGTGANRPRRITRNSRRCPLGVELLEDRALLSAMISVSDVSAVEGSVAMKFIDAFVKPQSGTLREPRGIDYGPDGNL